MAKQALKQDARRRVQEALAAKQKERMERERRQADLAVEILTAVAERDEAIATFERAAAVAIQALLGDRVRLDYIVELCDGQIDAKELQRLARIDTATTEQD
jgi:hypothetical protein